MRIILCLLTLNERPSLERVFPTIPSPEQSAAYDEVWAIDGGSTDGTIEFFRSHHVNLIQQTGKGRGGAFLTAFRELDADAFIFFSPDGNEDPADLPKFREHLDAGADLVIASRMMPGAWNEEDGQRFRWRKWANNAFTLLANLMFRRQGPYVTDAINGYRAITRAAARDLALDADNFTIEYQMTIRAMKQRKRIVEFPTHEGNRIAGETGAKSIPTGARFVKALGREVLHSRCTRAP